MATMFERYDQMILDWIKPPIKINKGAWYYDWSNRVVFAPIQRAFSTMSELTGYAQDKIPKPFISFSRLDDLSFDSSRISNGTFITYKYPTVNPTLYNISKYPMPYNIGYQIEVWTKYSEHMNWIIQWFLGQFDRELHVFSAVDHDHFGNKDIYMYLTNITNNTNIEPITDPTEFRYTISVLVRGYLVYNDIDGSVGSGGGESTLDPTEYGTVKEVDTYFYNYDDSDNPELLSSSEITE